jgi:ABC-type amino acid transport system permease subunit
MQSFRVYEPLFAVAVVYTLLSMLLLRCLAFLEAPQRAR